MVLVVRTVIELDVPDVPSEPAKPAMPGLPLPLGYCCGYTA